MKFNVKFPHLEEWQQPVFDDIRNELYDIYVVKAKRQVGKSILAESIVLYFACNNEGSISVIVEPTLGQSRRVFKQLLKSVGGEGSAIIKSANATLLEMELNNGSQILFKSAEQKDNLRGITIKKGILVIDEGAFISQDIYELLYPTVDATQSPILIISTPLFMSGEFYDKYIEGINSSIVKSYDWSLYDTSKYLSSDKLEYYRQRLSPLRFRSEYLGEFIAEGSYIFGELNAVTKAYSTAPSAYGGLDWGNGGENDFTVLVLLDDGANVTAIHSKNNLSPTLQINYYSEIINSIGTLRAVEVELNSIGTVYYDMLEQNVSTFVTGFQTTNESKRKIIEQLITAIQTHEITIPPDPELLAELQHYNMEKTKTGYTYNGADGYHDDYVLALAFAYDAWKNNLGSFSIAFA